jgi:hypothetical protein
MNNDIKISREFNNIEEAVNATSFDISYNPAVAKDAMNMKPHSGMEVTNVFTDESNQIWYIIKLVGENLNLLHKWYPFSSCLSDSPFAVYHREGDRLAYVGRMNKTAINRRMISKVGLIAGCQN